MDINDPALQLNPQFGKKKLLKDQVKSVVFSKSLESQRRMVKAIASELKISMLDCAAALAFLNETPAHDTVAPQSNKNNVAEITLPVVSIKLVRYRLDLGVQHELDEKNLKKILVNESGVDIKNIANVRIQETYTLIDLPDEMPQEIFHHLKSVEINGRKLDIRRVKARNKKRNIRRFRNNRTANPSTAAN